MKKNILAVLTVFALTLIGIGNASAAASDQAQALSNHHSEFALSINPGETAYIPFPKQNYPVNVSVTMPVTTRAIPLASSFVASDVQLDATISSLSGTAAACEDSIVNSMYRTYALLEHGSQPTIPICDPSYYSLVGIADVQPGMPNRIFIKIPVGTFMTMDGQIVTGPIPVYVSMWY